jgi:hypothetical protein
LVGNAVLFSRRLRLLAVTGRQCSVSGSFGELQLHEK